MSDVTFTSWGSANSIGPSCHVFTFGSTRIGIDFGAGSKPGEGRAAYDGRLDVLLYSHAHRDHAGMAPWAHTRWPDAKHCMTLETNSLANCIWNDELYVARKNDRPLPFTEPDIDRLNAHFRRLIEGRPLELGGGLVVTPTAAGHILGAVGFDIQYRGEHYVVTGDVSVRGHGFIDDADVRTYDRTRLMVRESTYVGQRLVEDRATTSARFIARVREVLARGGRVLIPAFTIDRAPEIYAILRMSDIDFGTWPLWVVGGKTPAEIYRDYTKDGYILGAMRRFTDRLEQKKARESRLPMIVLASSGMMMEDTASYAWALDILGEPNSAIFMVGWQDPNTPGGRILHSVPGDPVSLPTGDYRRLCEVERFVFTGHSYEDDMRVLEDRTNPDEIIHVHGEDARIDAFIASPEGRGRIRHKAEVGKVFTF